MGILRDAGRRDRSSMHGENNSRKANRKFRRLSRNSFFETAIVVDFISDPDIFLNETIDSVVSAPDDPQDLRKGQIRRAERRAKRLSTKDQFNNVDPSSLESIQKTMAEHFASDRVVNNVNLLELMPANSIIGYPVSDGNAQKKNQLEVFFPFFPPHFSLPVNAGEQVWIFYEADSRIGYWMFRKTGTKFVDDLNYTHIERQTVISQVNKSLENETDKEKIANILDTTALTFQSYSMEGKNSGTKIDYEDLKGRSLAYSDFVGEPVPRYSKKSADLVLQGSNNTLIVMTNQTQTDAGYSVDSGTIKIIAGRDKSSLNIVENELGYFEVDKLSALKKIDHNKDEGLSNIEKDAASIIITEEAGGSIRIGNAAGAYIELKSNGDISIVPSKSGVIKMGSEDADIALVGNTAFYNSTLSTVQSEGLILTSAGGVFGEGNLDTLSPAAIAMSGKFASKILVK